MIIKVTNDSWVMNPRTHLLKILFSFKYVNINDTLMLMTDVGVEMCR